MTVKWKTPHMGALAALVALLIGAAPTLAQGPNGEEPRGPYEETVLRLDRHTPANQYKIDHSEAENETAGEWYEAHGIAYSWHTSDGGSAYVFPDDWNDEAQAARAEYNATREPFPGFPQVDIDRVNQEVDEILAALDRAGIAAHFELDEEGFKTLIVDIESDAPDADESWNKANEAIAGLDR